MKISKIQTLILALLPMMNYSFSLPITESAEPIITKTAANKFTALPAAKKISY
jgi:hypothetical protein